jgi:TPR repeat protein
MLRRDMDWSSDDALTPAPKTYARDFYYDSDDDSPAAKATPPARPSVAARRAARDGRAAARPPETPIDRSIDRSSSASASRSRARLAGSSDDNPGASLCEEGDRLRLGFDVPRSVTGAFELYARAATEHDYPPAFFRLGACFAAEGLGAPDGPDEALALSWFSRGAEAHGDTQCLVALGEAHERKGDLPRAAGFFKTAAESARNAKTPGAREAKAHVARFAENGHCVSVIPSISEEESRRTHERLAKEGSVLSQRVLGMREARDVLESQTELRTDAERSARLERARALLASAAAAGDAEAINQLGILHEDGLIVSIVSKPPHSIGGSDGCENRDKSEHESSLTREAREATDVAKRLYARAARLGHERATNNLGFLCASAGEHAEAAAHFRAAALVHGDADAAHNLGHFYETGVGVEKDAKEAARLYAEAAAKGHESARDAATRLAAEATREDDEPPGSSGAASLRRRLAAKENETARLAKDLGEAKAETTRLKGKIAELKARNADLEKAKAKATHASSDAATAKNAFGVRDPSATERPREFTRSTSLMSDRTTHSNYSAYSGLSGVSARDAGEGGGGGGGGTRVARDATPAPRGKRLGKAGREGFRVVHGRRLVQRRAQSRRGGCRAARRAEARFAFVSRGRPIRRVGLRRRVRHAQRRDPGRLGRRVRRGRRRRRGGPRADEGARARDVRAEARDGGCAFQGGDARGDVLDALRAAQSHVRAESAAGGAARERRPRRERPRGGEGPAPDQARARRGRRRRGRGGVPRRRQEEEGRTRVVAGAGDAGDDEKDE